MNQTTSQLAESGARLVTDFRTLTAHAEELLNATKSVTGENVDMARQRLTESLQQARDHLVHSQDRLLTQGRAAATSVASFVREHPWQVVAGALAVGLLIGMISRRNGAAAAEDPASSSAAGG